MKTIKLVNRNQVIKLTHSGRRGPAGTISVGNVVTGDPGESVTITNVGTSTDAILNFVIPRGDPATNIVKSVNGKIDQVVLDTDDIEDTTTRRYTSDADIERLSNTSGTNTGDQDLSSFAIESSVASRIALKLNISDVINNLTTTSTNKALSAAQGKILKDTIDTINQIITSDDTSLNELQEIVDYIKANREELETLSIGAIAGLQDALSTKADVTALNAHTNSTNNPHSVTKAQVGLSNVPDIDFTADVTANTAARHTHSNKATLDATTASFTTTQENKLAGIAAGATANATDAQLRDRSTHTGTQAISTVAGLQPALDVKADLVDGKIPESQLPAYVDDVLSYNNLAAFPTIGDDGKIYIAKNTNLTYRWTGSAYTEISPSLALGETSATAYRGDRGKIAHDHTLNTSNPHSVTKAQVGLGNVPDLAPADLPVSTATQSALNAKANASDTVNLTGNQTVDGVKTFSSSPVVPTATTNTQAVNKAQMDAASAAHVAAADPHPQYMNSDRGDARYAGGTYSVMAKSQFASLSSSYGYLGKTFGNDDYENDLQVYGLSTQAGTPTPDAPVPIVSTTGDATVKSMGKNILNQPNQSVGWSGVTAIFSGSQITINGTSIGIADLSSTPYSQLIPAGTVLTMKSTLMSGSIVKNHPTDVIRVALVGKLADGSNRSILILTDTNGTASTTTTFEFVSVYVRITHFDTNVYNSVALGLQVEVGATATAYAPYVTSTQTLPLGTTQLRSLPNGVSDRIYKDGNAWKIEKNVGSVVYDGTEPWVDVSDAPGAVTYRFTLARQAYPNTLLDTTAAQTNMFARAFPFYANDVLSYYNSNSQFVAKPLRVTIDAIAGATVLAKWKAFLAATNLVYNYALVTPVVTTIADPTLIAALENIRTYQGITNITASTPVSGSYATQAINKAQMDAADALKVNKAGDTMTGHLTSVGAYISTSGTQLPFRHERTGSYSLSFGVAGDGAYAILDNNNSTTVFRAFRDGISLGSVSAPNIIHGTGFPNGVVSAPVGSTYIDRNATNGAIEWKKATGTSTTGWVVSVGDTGWRNLGQVWSQITENILLRRIGNVCYVTSQGEGLTISSTAVNSPRFMELGFRPSGRTELLIAFNGAIKGRILANQAEQSLFLTTNNTGAYNAIANNSYLTNNAWPVVLPGTAA